MADNAEAEPEDHVSVDQLTPEEASRIIHSHRKVRYGELSAMPLSVLSIYDICIMHQHMAGPRIHLANASLKAQHVGPVASERLSATTSNPVRIASRGNIPSCAPTSQTAPLDQSPHSPPQSQMAACRANGHARSQMGARPV